MSEARLTFTDEPDGKVKVNLNFGDEGTNEQSSAHHLAARAMVIVSEQDEDKGLRNQLQKAKTDLQFWTTCLDSAVQPECAFWTKMPEHDKPYAVAQLIANLRTRAREAEDRLAELASKVLANKSDENHGG
jgi:hypothetical protein